MTDSVEGLKYKIRVRVFKDEPMFGPGVAELMEWVEETGSLSEGCRKMGMAYSKGWKIMKRAEMDLGFALMEGARGGNNGGKTALTPKGKEFLIRYRRFESAIMEKSKDFFAKEFNDSLSLFSLENNEE